MRSAALSAPRPPVGGVALSAAVRRGAGGDGLAGFPAALAEAAQTSGAPAAAPESPEAAPQTPAPLPGAVMAALAWAAATSAAGSAAAETAVGGQTAPAAASGPRQGAEAQASPSGAEPGMGDLPAVAAPGTGILPAPSPHPAFSGAVPAPIAALSHGGTKPAAEPAPEPIPLAHRAPDPPASREDAARSAAAVARPADDRWMQDGAPPAQLALLPVPVAQAELRAPPSLPVPAGKVPRTPAAPDSGAPPPPPTRRDAAAVQSAPGIATNAAIGAGTGAVVTSGWPAAAVATPAAGPAALPADLPAEAPVRPGPAPARAATAPQFAILSRSAVAGPAEVSAPRGDMPILAASDPPLRRSGVAETPPSAAPERGVAPAVVGASVPATDTVETGTAAGGAGATDAGAIGITPLPAESAAAAPGAPASALLPAPLPQAVAAAGRKPPSPERLPAPQSASAHGPDLSGGQAVALAVGLPPAPAEAAGKADNAAPAAEAAPLDLTTQLSDRIAAAVASGRHDLVLRLHPPELGEVGVRLVVTGRAVSAWFDSPQPRVEQAIGQSLGELRADLATAGYDLSGAWVGGEAWTPRERSAGPLPPRPGRDGGAPAPQEQGAAPAARMGIGMSIYV